VNVKSIFVVAGTALWTWNAFSWSLERRR